MASAAMPVATPSANRGAARKPRVLQEFAVVDLPADHPARQLQYDAPVPPGVEEEDAPEEDAAAKERENETSKSSSSGGEAAAPGRSSSSSSSSFLDQTVPQPVRLSDAAIARASAALRPGDEAGARVLRQVFGASLPWTEKELFRSK